MADPSRTVPEAATNRDPERPAEGEAALRAAIEEYGGDYAAALERADDLEGVVTTAVLVAASAEDEEVDHFTEAVVSLVNAADGLATDDAVALAEGVGEHGGDLAEALDRVARLQREGHLDPFLTLAEALSESLDDEQVDRLARAVREDGDALAGTLESVLELEREGHLDSLLDTAETLSALDVDADAVDGMNRFLSAVGDAERERHRSTGLLGMVRGLGGGNVRAGLGYLLALLRAQGRRLRRGE